MSSLQPSDRRRPSTHSTAPRRPSMYSTVQDTCPECWDWDFNRLHHDNCEPLNPCGCSCRATSYVPYEVAIRIVSSFCVMFMLLEFGVGGRIFDFFDPSSLSFIIPNARGLPAVLGFGAWWGGIGCGIAGVFGLVARWRWAIVVSTVIGGLAVVPAVVGAIWDSAMYFSYIGTLKSCASHPAIPNSNSVMTKENWKCYGDFVSCNSIMTQCLQPNSKLSTSLKWAQYTDDFFNKAGYTNPRQCLCWDRQSNCQALTISTSSQMLGYTCGDIIKTLPSTLQASISFCVLCAISATILSIMGCISLTVNDRKPIVVKNEEPTKFEIDFEREQRERQLSVHTPPAIPPLSNFHL